MSSVDRPEQSNTNTSPKTQEKGLKEEIDLDTGIKTVNYLVFTHIG